MIYFEDEKSRLLYRINKENLLRKHAPYLLDDKGNIERIYSSIYKLAVVIKHKINRHVYENACMKRTDDERITVEVDSIPKVAIYTCIIGDYDNLLEPIYSNKFMDFYIVTDRVRKQDSQWKEIYSKDFEYIYGRNLDNQRINRFFKLHPDVLFPEYEYSIYIDGSMVVMSDVIPIILSLGQNQFIGLHNHPDRNHLYNEKIAILRAKRPVEIKKLNKQLKDYYDDGYDDSLGLYENTIIVRRHNDEKCKKIMNDWWDNILKYSSRDQISLPYVLWKNGLRKEDVLKLGDNLKLNPRFYYLGHK